MTDRPIPFSAPMVRALLAGTKTQTRRIVKPSIKGCTVGSYSAGGVVEPVNVRDGEPWDQILCPYGQPGDRLWVRETTSESEPCFLGGKAQPTVWYRADCNRPTWAERKWTPSILSPRRLSRITLEITDVSVQRLQEISEEDATAEGTGAGDYWPGAGDRPATARAAYRDLWESINGPNSWDLNPWVWAITFKRITP
jgi:hypothetical protein